MNERELELDLHAQLKLEKAIKTLEEVKPELNQYQEKLIDSAITKIEYAFNIYGGRFYNECN